MRSNSYDQALADLRRAEHNYRVACVVKDEADERVCSAIAELHRWEDQLGKDSVRA